MVRQSFRVLVLAFGVALGATAEDRYIDDIVFVPLRAGSGTDFKLVHQGLASGTPVVLLEDDAGTGWSRVRTRDGVEGWLPNRYLKTEPGARYQVRTALQTLGKPDDGSVSLTTAIEEARKEIEVLAATRDTLQAELAELRQLSSSAQQLDESNRQLIEKNHLLTGQLGVLEAENQRLRDDTWSKWFINGVWATVGGGLLTLLLPRLLPARRRRSEWA